MLVTSVEEEKIEMEKIYEQILYLLESNPHCPRHTFYAIDASPKHISALIHQGIKQGHIREESVSYRNQKTEIKERLLTITAKGVHCLSAGSEAENEELFLRSEEDKTVASPGEKKKTTQTKKRMIKKAEANVFMELVYNAALQTADDCFMESGPTQEDYENFPIQYTDIQEVKNILFGSDPTQQLDYSRCSFCGIADSRYSSFLVYSAHDVGMKWLPWINSTELKLFRQWFSRNGRDRFKPGAFLLVKNLQQFYSLYNDTAGVRTEKQKTVQLGNGLSSFHVVPVDSTGVKHLTRLMLNDPAETRKEIIREAIERAEFLPSDRGEDDVFPLIDTYNLYTAIGTDLDIRQMQKIEAVLEFTGISQFAVICYDWQQDYWFKLFPGTTVYTRRSD